MKILFRWLLIGVLVFGFVGCGGGGTTPQKDETNSPTTTETNSSSETNSPTSTETNSSSETNNPTTTETNSSSEINS